MTAGGHAHKFYIFALHCVAACTEKSSFSYSLIRGSSVLVPREHIDLLVEVCLTLLWKRQYALFQPVTLDQVLVNYASVLASSQIVNVSNGDTLPSTLTS